MGRQKRQTGFSIVEAVIAVVAIAIIGTAGFFVYQHNRPKDTGATGGTQTTNQQSDTTGLYAGWTTVRLANEKLSFKYPSGWTLATAPDINNNSDKSNENIEVNSPVSNGHYFGITLQAGKATATGVNLNFLGDASGTTVANLSVPGGSQPLYLDAQTISDQNHITCLALATTPGSMNHDTSFGILDSAGKGPHNIVMYACLTPVNATAVDNGAEYATQEYTTNPYYQTVIQIFQSLSYK